MMNVKRKSGKITYRKGMRLLAAAALTAAMISGQAQGVLAQSEATIETAVSILPENITIEEPVPLAEISLPESEYGTLSWVDSSCVPSQRVQSYEVKLSPFDSVDLSGEEGWDSQAGVLRGFVTVVVSSIEDTDSTEEALPSETPDQTVTPGISAAPDISQIPDAEGQVTGIPDQEENSGGIADEVQEEEEVGEAVIGEEEISSPGESEESKPTPEVTETPVENIFDQEETDLTQDERPMSADENLSPDEQMVRAAENHSCNGISVSGISLPWYVQFRVSSGDAYEFTNEIDASIFKSYEFELWDLRTDTEYEIPDGEYISVTVPVKEGYEYTIEHLLDNGAIETIIPSVDGDTMVFSTHSFSPFGIAGSKPVIGSDIAEQGYGDDNTSQLGGDDGATTEVPVSPAASSNTTTASGTNQATAQNTSAPENTQENTQGSGSSSTGAVETGDDTMILPFAALAAAAAMVMTGTAVAYKKRK